MGLEVSNLISKNMTKSIPLWLSFPWVFNDLPVLRVQMLLTNERTISSWIDQWKDRKYYGILLQDQDYHLSPGAAQGDICIVENMVFGHIHTLISVELEAKFSIMFQAPEHH